MKAEFEKYFQRLAVFSMNRYGKKPSVTYSSEIDKRLLCSEPDEDGEAEWRPVLQTKQPDWNIIETRLGIRVCPELKEYYSTYSFLTLSGKYGDVYLNFYPVGTVDTVEDTVLREYEDGRYFFPGANVFLIGNASINNDDGYYIFFDNQNNEVFCYEHETQKKRILSDSLSRMIGNMEARI